MIQRSYRLNRSPFNGKEARWRPWKKKFLVQASRKGYKDVLTGVDVVLSNTAIGLLDASAQAQARTNNIEYKKQNEFGI